MHRALVALLALALVGFVPPKVELKRRVSTVRVRVTDTGQTYSAINTIECLGWPSDEIKTLAGSGRWNGWNPPNGAEGVAIGRSKHCFQGDVTVVIVQIDGYYAPIGTKGLAFERGTVDDVPLFERRSP